LLNLLVEVLRKENKIKNIKKKVKDEQTNIKSKKKGRNIFIFREVMPVF
jgi:hypothetical protein